MVNEKKRCCCFVSSIYLSIIDSSDIPSQPSLLLVVKWGGQLTQTGKNQAEALGKVNNLLIKLNFKI